MSTADTVETFAPAPPGTHPPLDYPGYRSTHLRHPNHDPLRLDPGKLDRSELSGPLFGEGAVTAADADLTIGPDRRSGRAADHRHRTAARCRRPTDRRLAHRAVAGQRLRPLPPCQRQLAGNPRPQLHRRRALPHRHRRHATASRRSAPAPIRGATTPTHGVPPHLHFSPVRPLVHAAAGHPDVLPRRSAVLPGPDLQLRPRAVPPRRSSPATTTTQRPRSGRSGSASTSSCAARIARRSRSDVAAPLTLTPSQTVGPFLHIALADPAQRFAVAARSPGRSTSTAPSPTAPARGVPDALIETWQADGLFARCPTDDDGRYEIYTRKPPAVATVDGTPQAPHLSVSVFARGLLDRVVTRIYFPDEDAANSADPTLADRPCRAPPPARRHRRSTRAVPLRHPPAGRR